ncbi:MAG: ferredoxin domain-containing protein [Desulfurispora sp.]|uniref:ferredoxin domain-containing protein n=1 Tax=Desulfurispora sp. TaxID=3014275 RepID=UPI00404B9593
MQNALSMVAELMALSARTAPKSLGQDYVEIKIVSGEDLHRLADAMEQYGRRTGKVNFDRDAAGVRQAAAVLLLSLKENKPLGLNCGACGCDRCDQLSGREGPEFVGPLCAWRVIDLGIALGSAVKTASMLNADNRVMYRAGVVARQMGLIGGAIAIGVPIAGYSKNIFFDRPVKS